MSEDFKSLHLSRYFEQEEVHKITNLNFSSVGTNYQRQTSIDPYLYHCM